MSLFPLESCTTRWARPKTSGRTWQSSAWSWRAARFSSTPARRLWDKVTPVFKCCTSDHSKEKKTSSHCPSLPVWQPDPKSLASVLKKKKHPSLCLSLWGSTCTPREESLSFPSVIRLFRGKLMMNLWLKMSHIPSRPWRMRKGTAEMLDYLIFSTSFIQFLHCPHCPPSLPLFSTCICIFLPLLFYSNIQGLSSRYRWARRARSPVGDWALSLWRRRGRGSAFSSPSI